jgi:hypothetical protein
MMELVMKPRARTLFRTGVSRATWRPIVFGLAAFVLVGNSAPGGWLERSGLTAAEQVPDEELAAMRGKFIAPDSVTDFGITLQTLWQTADGVITAAKMALNVSFAGGHAGTPQITVGWIRDGDPTMDVTSFGDGNSDSYVTYSANGLPGLNSVSGAVQSNVIAGTDNRVQNAMAVQIVPANSIPDVGGGTPITATRTDIAPDGDTIKFVVSSGQLGMIVQDAQGAGVVRQMISDNPGQLSQNVFLGGTANVIDNVMNVTIGIDQLRDLNNTQMVNALSAMKGHGF